MIVVLKPSGSYGHSFRGLHDYCANNVGTKTSQERVAWTATRNLALDDPEQAYKIMVQTAAAQNDLKRVAGKRPGPPPKDGPVLHAVLAFDADEPQSQAEMTAAADEFLSRLGANPAKSKAKSGPKEAQFADEHQVIMYAHNDSSNGATHLHLAINRVHPRTGVLLPDKNDRHKAQSWALAYSKRYGTDHKTPAREENQAERTKGHWVKHPNRRHRRAYELEKALEAQNDNSQITALKDEQRRQDRALFERGVMPFASSIWGMSKRFTPPRGTVRTSVSANTNVG